jgi:hypothetical protein
MLRENQAPWDRAMRIIMGAAMLLLGWTEVVGGPPGIALKLFGWVPFLTGIAGWDPLYSVLDYSTKSRHRKHS